MMEDWADKGRAVLGTRPDGAIVMQRAEMEIIVRSYASFKEGARFAFLGRWICVGEEEGDGEGEEEETMKMRRKRKRTVKARKSVLLETRHGTAEQKVEEAGSKETSA